MARKPKIQGVVSPENKDIWDEWKASKGFASDGVALDAIISSCLRDNGDSGDNLTSSSTSDNGDNRYNELADEVARLSRKLEQMQDYFLGLSVPVPSDDVGDNGDNDEIEASVSEPDTPVADSTELEDKSITKSDTDEVKDDDDDFCPDYDYSKFNSDEAIKESIEIGKPYTVTYLASVLGISTNAIYQWIRGMEVGSSFDKRGYCWEVASTDPQTLKVTAKL